MLHINSWSCWTRSPWIRSICEKNSGDWWPLWTFKTPDIRRFAFVKGCGKGVFFIMFIITLSSYDYITVIIFLQHADSEKVRSSRNGSSSKYATRPGSSGEPATEGPSSRIVSSMGARTSTTQRAQPGYETKTSGFSRPTKGSREDPLRSFEFLQIRK